ncbi:MAG TPA: electron transport complex subunit RsxC [Candidatus Brocadiia bacterium]|nr:electron transport complex subunit RsxC [Candidatus Brocadiia bacterium]
MKVAMKTRAESLDNLGSAKKVAVIVCKRCFHEFEKDAADDLDIALETLANAGVEAVVSMEADFLCNSRVAARMLEGGVSEGFDAVVTLCGAGAQVVAGLSGKTPVILLGNARPERGFEGISLGVKRCMACGKCLLNLTGGICPVADCAKSLSNGPCGGAKDGKCEANAEKDCAWIRIYKRLKEQGRLDALKGDVQDRDFSRPLFAEVKKIEDKALERRETGFAGGLYPLENKDGHSDLAIETLPDPQIAVVPMAQHVGAPCESRVAVGDAVSIGQEIGGSTGYVSSAIHAPISGKVVAVEKRPHPTIPGDVLSVVIENDGKSSLHESCAPRREPDSMTPEEIIDVIRRSGIVGMGGAMFPTDVKLKPPRPVDLLILNGCECAPHLTADDRLMVEKSAEIVGGAKFLAKALGVGKVIIAIENNKSLALERMKEAAGDAAEVISVTTKYPQGAERMLIKRLTGRDVPRGGLPFEVGAVVNNVGTALAVYEAVVLGMPLISRVITVSGMDIPKPGNYRVKIGTRIRDVLNAVGAANPDAMLSGRTVRMGGGMMGVIQTNADAPIIKGASGLIVLETSDIAPDDARKCIRCGRCVEACPMGLEPHRLWRHVKDENWEMVEQLGCNDCFDCGCCEYICSSKLPLVAMFKRGKAALRRKKDAGNPVKA